MIEQRSNKVMNREQVELKMLSLSLFDWSIIISAVIAVLVILINLSNLSATNNLHLSKVLLLIPTYRLIIAAVVGIVAQYYKQLSLETQRVSILDSAIILNIFVLALIISSIQQMGSIWASFDCVNSYCYYPVIVVTVMSMFLLRVDLILRNATCMTIICSLDFIAYAIAKQYNHITFTAKHDIIVLLNSAVAAVLIIVLCCYAAQYLYKIFAVYSLREAKLRHYKTIAETDALTKLSNRRAFDLDLELLATTPVKVVAIAMFDIDDFKKFNDEYGHSTGDYVLEQVGRLIASFNDYNGIEAYRYGGEELTVMFSYVAPSYNIEEQIELFRHAVSNVKIPNVKRSITISAGLAYANIGSITAGNKRREALTKLIEAADKNLYDAKHTGKDKLCVTHEQNLDTVKQGE